MTVLGRHLSLPLQLGIPRIPKLAARAGLDMTRFFDSAEPPRAARLQPHGTSPG